MFDILTVFLIGLGVIIHPCTIAPNIAALTFLSQAKKHAQWAMVLFVVGHTFAYILLSGILVVLAQKTTLLASIQKNEIWGHYILVALFLVAGIWFIWSSFRSHHHHKLAHNVLTTPLGAFISGIGIAYLFCPEAAFVFFGMVIPTAITSQVGFAVSIAFAIGTALPLFALCWALATGKQQFMSKLNIPRRLINRTLGVVFLLAAIIILVF